MSDNLVNRLHDRRVCSPAQNSCRNDYVLNQAADRIEELEAKLSKSEALLAKAVEALKFYAMRDVSYLNAETATFQDYVDYRNILERTSTTLAELEGETDE